ncbi:hypothetical protein DL96DRAFT_1709156 [Flagelloscypha sp. PMI_526]|nr:hypothetical protein DL96DRAFT_1709156 [Flagelloscypha sp. PMI_526]
MTDSASAIPPARNDTIVLPNEYVQASEKNASDQSTPETLEVSQLLPVELWVEIFYILSTSPFGGTSPRGPIFSQGSCLVAPLSVSHVCQWWRKIALQEPQLWSRLGFRIQDSFPDTKISLVQTFLDRSQHEPLRVTVVVNPKSTMSSDPDLRNKILVLLRMLLDDHLDRIQAAILQLPPSMFNHHPFPIASAPLLARLNIVTSQTVRGTAWEPCFVRHAPRLMELTVQNFVTSTESLAAMIPWGNLTQVSFRTNTLDYNWGYSPIELCHVLKTCPSLTFLHFDGYGLRSRQIAQHAEFHHPKLQKLVISLSNFQLLKLCSFPSLHELHLDQINTEGTAGIVNAQDVANFIERSPYLTSMKIIDFQGADVVGILPQGNIIRDLTLSICDPEFMDPRHGVGLRSLEALESRHLPHLEHCEVQIFYERVQTTFDNGATLHLSEILKALVHRIHSERPSVIFRINGRPKYLHPTTLDALRSMQQLGLINLTVDLHD